MKIVRVTSCHGCPYESVSEPLADDEKYHCDRVGRWIETPHDDKPIPGWCPLEESHDTGSDKRKCGQCKNEQGPAKGATFWTLAPEVRWVMQP